MFASCKIKKSQLSGKEINFLMKKKRTTRKRGAPYGNKARAGTARLLTLQTIAKLEGTTHPALRQKLIRLKVSLADYVANLLKDYAVGLEKDLAEVAVSSLKKGREAKVEDVVYQILVKIFEENPHLKKKENEKTN